jgi:hypothetical protein
MNYKYLHEETINIILSKGDIVIDVLGGNIGILTKHHHRVDYDIWRDDLYIWEVFWINNPVSEYYSVSPAPNLIEEEGLKLSIVVGVYRWHSITGKTYEIP